METTGDLRKYTPNGEWDLIEMPAYRRVLTTDGRGRGHANNRKLKLYYDFDSSIVEMFCLNHLLGCYCHAD